MKAEVKLYKTKYDQNQKVMTELFEKLKGQDHEIFSLKAEIDDYQKTFDAKGETI